MKMLLHYLCMGVVVAKKQILLLWHIVVRSFFVVVRLINCFFIINKKSPTIKTNQSELCKYYSDQGKIPDVSPLHHNCRVDLSIIIPSYNVSQYICECIESIVNQKTDYTYEIILIDDGSTDNTLDLIHSYIASYRVKLYSQENAGQSVARNNGISHSSGRYIMFIDADDVLLPGAIQSLIQTAEETGSDIVEGNIVRFYNEITDDMIGDSQGKNHIESNDENSGFVLTTYGYSVAKVYKRELWGTLRFPEGYIFEDVITKFILRRKANQVAFIETVVYGYRRNVSSSTHGTPTLKHLDSIWVLPRILELCEQEDVPRDDVLYLLSLNHIGNLNYITTRPHSKEIQLACFAEMKKQLLSIQDCRPKRMPLMFRLLDRAILENKYEAWEYTAETIQKYQMLKKWREIN